ncbi:reverse transcriptase [Plakobranchus ocellatus]|uniref:Reverse transcriptase n=1 Tax=Plakobranchus ocellatus TaxID=259542 RepID=A0AAV4AC26_9GAST|nr:reverse transcriptase [Plakobranchus ocellatus]
MAGQFALASLTIKIVTQVNGWARKDWAIHLAALLKGKALDVYTRLDEEDAQKYDKCRDALLKRYNLTQDGFQEKFRRSRPEAGESISQFKTRIQSYLDKWLHLAGKDKSNPDDLIDFVIMEQLMNICSKDLVVFLKERKPKSADDLIGLAEKYVEAHGETRALSRTPPEKKADERSSHPPQLHTGAAKQPIQCRRCKRFGHIEKFCKTKILSVIKEVQCSFCGRRNHSERECWKKQRQLRESDAQKVDVVGSRNDNIPAVGACPCKGTIITAACTTGHVQMSSRMPTAVGYVDGKRETVLRDSGCSCVVIRHGLAKRSPDGKKKISINLADGTTLHAPVTDAMLECPFYTGKVDVVEMKSPLYDVILGNIPGAKCPGIAQQYETMAVETRSKKGHKMNLKNGSQRYKKHFDFKAKARKFEVGDKVLLLLPTKFNKLQLKWQGPFVVLQRLGENNHKVAVGKAEKNVPCQYAKEILGP